MPDFVLDHEPAGFARIKVVGVGGGGCNAVDSMFDIGLQNVEFYVINSDLQALKRSKCPNRIQIGAKLTQGRGCGANPELGENCMMDARDELSEVLQGADIVFVTAGLGGGTGTGAAPVVAKAARELGILTVAVVTKPFKFEGPRRMKSAEGGLEKLHEACDTMIVINNERLLEHVGPKVPMKESFKIADNVLSQAVSSISDLVATPGLINVDFNDVRTIMGAKGGAVMGVGVGKGENRAAEAVKKATNSPLLDKIVIDGATGVLICITGGPEMTLAEVNDATQMVHEAADPDAEIIFGAVIDESLTDTLRVTIIATGFPDDVQRRQMMGAAREKTGESAGAELPPPPAREHMEVRRPSKPASEEEQSPKSAPLAERPSRQSSGGNGGNGEQPNSLRRTLESMMKQQSSGEEDEPRIHVAKSNPPPQRAENGGFGPGGHPNVRPASGQHREGPSVKTAPEEPAPQVNLYDPASEEEAQEEQSNFDTPAFLRRRRSLFE